MISKFDAVNTLEFKNFFIILPDLSFKGISLSTFKKYPNKPKFCESNFSYNSLENNQYLSVSEIKNLIKDFKNNLMIFYGKQFLDNEEVNAVKKFLKVNLLHRVQNRENLSKFKK